MWGMGRKRPPNREPERKYNLLGRLLLIKWRGKRLKQDAAHEIGIDVARYGQFESGKARPGVDWAFIIEEVTGGAVPADSWAKEPEALAS